MNQRPNFKYAFIMLAVAAAWPLQGHAAAGVAQFIAGDVNVRRGGGTESLAKGKPIESGDDIVTGATGSAQIKFSDGGLVSLQPNTQFKIDKYNDANDPKQDSYLVNFVRGGMRAITGLIGKRNHDNYRVTTATATIGIRGSAFSSSYNADGSINVATEKDEIEVCTNAGCVGLKLGESARVGSNTQAPVRTGVITTFPVTPPPLPVTFSTASDKLTNPDTGLTGTFDSMSLGYTVSDPSYTYGVYTADYYPSTAVFDKGLLTSFVSDGGEGSTTFTPKAGAATSFGAVGKLADADFIGWGYWSAATEVSSGYGGTSDLKDFHYFVGRGTSQSDMDALGSMVGQYSMIGGTAPTATYSGSSQFGTLVGGSMTAYFGSHVEVAIDTKFGGSTFTASVSSAYISGSTFYGNEGNSSVNGQFIGPNATRAGVVYQQTGTSVGTINGAATFQRTSLVPGMPPS